VNVYLFFEPRLPKGSAIADLMGAIALNRKSDRFNRQVFGRSHFAKVVVALNHTWQKP
jgi:hypothetical protein